MVAIHLELLHGTIRAGSPDDLTLTGREDPGEWPPSPARLFAALVAADGTRDRCRVTDASGLQRLEQAKPPIIVADARDRVCVSPLAERFVVENALMPKRKPGGAVATQEYVARQNTSVRPAPRISPCSPMVTYLWPGLELTGDALTDLQRRAARVGYLGCADSPVRMQVIVGDNSALLDGSARRWEPDDEGRELLPVPYPGLTDVLDRMYDDFSGGLATRRSWYRAERRRYRSPTEDRPDPRPRPSVVWLRLERPVPGRHVLLVTEALRSALLTAYERDVTGSADDVPRVLHGHGFEAAGYDHAYWLGLPDVGHPYASGRIHGAAVMLPPAAAPEVVEGVRTAAWAVRELRLPGGERVEIAPHRGERRPWAAHPRRWLGPAARWRTAFPVVHERWSKKGPDMTEVARWCRHAGLPDPVSFRIARPPFLPGGVSLMPHETARRGRERRPYSHLEVSFGEPLTGPVVLGRLRHFGTGLMVPADAPAREHTTSKKADDEEVTT